MDLWYGFACYGLDLLNSHGYLCFIAQNNWTTSTGAKKLRYKVTSETKILQLLDFNAYRIFNEAGIQTMVMLFAKTNPDQQLTDYRCLMEGATEKDLMSLLNKSKSEFVSFKSVVVNSDNPSDAPLLFSGNGTVLSKILHNKEYLNDREIAQGIVFPQDFLDRKRQKILNSHSVGDGIFALSDSELLGMHLNEKERLLIKPFYTSSEIKRYYTMSRNHLWIIYTDSSYKDPYSLNECPTIKSHLDEFQKIITSSNKPYGLHRARNESFFRGEKIISLRKCAGSPCFSYSNFDCYVSQTYFVIKTTRWDMLFLTGVLNSRLIAYWLKNRGKMQGVNYQIDKEPLLSIPLPPSSITQTEISSLVRDIIQNKLENPNYDSSELENRIDNLVFDIYGISANDIDNF